MTTTPIETSAEPPTTPTRCRPTRASTCGCTSPGMSSYADAPVPTIVRGEGARIFDANGRSYLDGLAGLFVVQAGHGREELARAAYEQAKRARVLPAVVLRATRRRSSWPTGSPTTRPAT